MFVQYRNNLSRMIAQQLIILVRIPSGGRQDDSAACVTIQVSWMSCLRATWFP